MNLLKSRLLVFFVPLLLSAPFLNRAYFVDDQFFVHIAHWLKDNPSRPYDFSLQDSSSHAFSKEQLLVSIVNPLFHHYYLAFLIKVGGEREWFLRLGCVLLSCLAALFIFELARRWLRFPLLSTIFVLVTPTFWVGAHSMLIDPTMNLFFLAALFLFIQSMEKESWIFSAVAGVCLGLALLTKYTAILAVPLLAYLALIEKHGKKKFIFLLLTLAIGAFFHFSYSAFTNRLYGETHVTASMAATLNSVSWGKLLVLCVFISAGTIAPLLIWGFLSRPVFYFCLVLLFGLCFAFVTPWGGLKSQAAILMSFFSVSLIVFLGFFAFIRRQWKPGLDSFLLFWGVSFIAMMAVVMPWVAMRYLLISVPAFVFLLVRLIEIRKPFMASTFIWGGIIGSFLVSASLSYADYQQAESSRTILKELKARGHSGRNRRYFWADSFTMAYMKMDGWAPCFDVTQLLPGDHILVADVTSTPYRFIRANIPLRRIDTIDYQGWFPLRVMDSKAGAGFYGSAWGPLPYAFSRSPWERMYLFEVISENGK